MPDSDGVSSASCGLRPPGQQVVRATLIIRSFFLFAVLLIVPGVIRADGRAGSVEFSDGRKLAGAISLTSGKTLRLFVGDKQLSIELDQVKQIAFTPEKEEMFAGFYFPNAGQATQAKTGEVYPIRYLGTDITLADGKTLSGHLYTTTFYVEGDDATEKVVVMAKQTGVDKEKMADLIYPTVIRFDAASPAAGTTQLDLTQFKLKNIQPPVVITRPDLAFVAMQQQGTQPVWTLQIADPQKVFVSVRAADGFHVGWPAGEPDPDRKKAADAGLKLMMDFYNEDEVLGYITDSDAGEVYMLALLKRTAPLVDGGGATEHDMPWSLVLLRWKYDAEQKKVTLLNRALLGIGRQDSNHPLPTVLKQPELLTAFSAIKQP